MSLLLALLLSSPGSSSVQRREARSEAQRRQEQAEEARIVAEETKLQQADALTRAIEDAAKNFSASKPEIEKRLAGLETLTQEERWMDALNTGQAIQRDLEPLFRSEIGNGTEVTAIKTQLDDFLAVARERQNVIRRRQNAYGRANGRNDLQIVNESWTTTGFGSIAEWDVTIKNTSDVAIYSDVRYTTEYSAASGTTLHTNDGTIYEVIKPGQARRFSELNDGFIPDQVKRASFVITGATKSRP